MLGPLAKTMAAITRESARRGMESRGRVRSRDNSSSRIAYDPGALPRSDNYSYYGTSLARRLRQLIESVKRAPIM